MPSVVKVNEISSVDTTITPVIVKSHIDLQSLKDLLNVRDITVNRNVTIGGNLTVTGSTALVQSDTLQIKDKNIELAKTDNPTDILADGGGITLKGATDKTLNWIDATDSWTSSEHMNLANGKEFKINGTTVLSSTQVLGKVLPTGTIVGTSDSQNLTNKTINNITYPISDGTDGQVLTTNGSGVLSFSTISSGNNPITLDLQNSNTTINLSLYKTTSFRIKNPAQITLSNGINGVWYTFVIVSDGTYSFTSEVRFPLNNSQPVPSVSESVDVYSFHCVNTTSGLKYLATFAYDYSEVVL